MTCESDAGLDSCCLVLNSHDYSLFQRENWVLRRNLVSTYQKTYSLESRGMKFSEGSKPRAFAATLCSQTAAMLDCACSIEFVQRE